MVAGLNECVLETGKGFKGGLSGKLGYNEDFK